MRAERHALPEVLDQGDPQRAVIAIVVTAAASDDLGHGGERTNPRNLGWADVSTPRIMRGMTSLHIEHRVNDLQPWLETFSSFDDVRAKGGVTAVQVRHAAEDANQVAVDLEFDSREQATRFLTYLETEVWPSSPFFTGTPSTSILEPIALGAATP